MIAPSNPTPLVIFAVIAMMICGILGMVLGQDPFGPGQEVRAELARTQQAVEIQSTETARSALATSQAMFFQQTFVPAGLTAMPIQQAATQVAGQIAVEAAQINATQTIISGDLMNRQLANQATQMAMARSEQMEAVSAESTSMAMVQSQTKEQANSILRFSVVVIGGLILCGWIIARTFAQIAHARAQEKVAQAQFLAEQRRMASLRASLRNQNGGKSHQHVSNSLMKKTGDANKLSKAE